jgi:hypothetical protein
MDKNIIDKVNKQVYKKFPEVVGLKPSIRKQTGSKQINASRSSNQDSFLLTYKFSGVGPGGRKIPQFVRVVATSSGKIIKMSTSK